jgi:hypothetical protein
MTIKLTQLYSDANDATGGYQDTVLSLTPASYYPLNDTINGTMFDIVGGRNFTRTVAPGVLGESSLLDRDSRKSTRYNYANTNSANVIASFPISACTFGCLVRPNGLLRGSLWNVNLPISGQTAALTFYLSGDNNASSNTKAVMISQNIAFYNSPDITAIPVNSTAFVAMTLNGTNLRAFVNGICVLSVTTSGSAANAGLTLNQVTFGYYGSGANGTNSLNMQGFFYSPTTWTQEQLLLIEQSRY